MFQFARLDIQEKQEKYQIDYDKEMENSIEYEKVQKRIDRLLVLKNRIIRCKRKIPLSILGGFLFFFVFGFENAFLAILYSIIPFSLVVSGLKATFDKNRYEKQVQNEYSDLADMSYDELQEKSRYFSQRSFDSYHRAMVDRDSNRSLESTLEQMDRCENILEDSKKFFMDPYYLADSKEDYEELMKKYNSSKIIFEEYLNQPIDYSNVSFDHQVSTPIDYTEKTKQLMKSYRK